jgi:aminopeptidase N
MRDMKKLTQLLLMLAMPLGAASAQVTENSRTGNSRPGIDVLQYTFHVDFPAKPFPDTIRFTSMIRFTRSRGTADLSLDLVAAMQVDSIRINGTPVRYTRSGDRVALAFSEIAGDTVVVAVHYHGSPLDGLIISRDPALGWTAFGDNFPDRARQWLAVVDHPSDKALVEWVVRAPSTHRVIANGELLEETPEIAPAETPMVLTRWITRRPIYTAVMVIGVAPFAVVELGETACGLAERPGCVRQSVWTVPSKRAVVPGNFARAGEMVALFSRLAGPYPYEKLAHVASSTRYGGMENAGAIFYAASLFRPGSPSEGLIAHETAHQWFGDAVTEREWPHVWLSEGFATYFAALWTEHAHGDSAFRGDLMAMRKRVLGSPITNQKPVIDEALNDLARVLNTNVYEKAGFVLHMLRREIRDSAFFGGIRAYYAAHRHGNALTADLQREFERTSGQSLEWFFAQWMRRPGTADVSTSWRYDAATLRVVLTVTQGTAFPPYRLSLCVDVVDAQGATQRVRVMVPAAATASVGVNVTLSSAPQRVIVDADVSLLGTLRQ